MGIFLQGMAVGAGLIVAIGAQNSFVLAQGIRRQYRGMVAAVCSLADLVLIFAGAAGIGSGVAAHSGFQTAAAWGGAGFLFWYGLKSMRSAVRGQTLSGSDPGRQSRRAILSATLALTFLNPHVYLDTVLLLGGISGQYAGAGRFVFAAGAGCASCLWFFSLAFGGSLLAPLFARRATWRLLDALVCAVMWCLAVQLLPLDRWGA